MGRHRQAGLSLCFLVVLLFLRLPSQTLAAEVAYRPPRDYAEAWAKALALLMALGSIALILFTLGARRRRLSGLQARALLVVGICVLPLPVMMMSTAVGLEQAKDVDFCRSCHAMRPFVEDMHDPGSPRLAAVHFKNRYIQQDHCYVCHTDYGLFGTVEAKVGGMSHVWREVAGTYQLPIAVKGGYRYTICLNCHGPSLKFAQREEHAGVIEKTLSGQPACTECHELSHPPRSTRSQL